MYSSAPPVGQFYIANDSRFSEEVFRTLRELGHDVERWPRFTPIAGGACVVLRDPDSGLVQPSTDPVEKPMPPSGRRGGG